MEKKIRLMDMPTTVRGFCYHDDEGEEFVILNSRLTREANQHTLDHEREHIRRGDMWNMEYVEYKKEE